MLSRLSALSKTTAARLSALYLLLFALCAVILLFYTTQIAVNSVMKNTKALLNQELANLGRTYNANGVRGLVRDIDRRSRRPDAYVYLVSDAAGRYIAGNVSRLEERVMEEDGFVEEPFRYVRIGDEDRVIGDDSPRAIGTVIRLDNGLTILVGRDLRGPQRLRGVVRQSLGIGLAVMVGGGLLIWFLVGSAALRRIDRVSVASARIVGGDLSERLPVSPASDEFDRLSSSLNDMLDRIETLNSGLRDVSDSIAHDLKTPLTRIRNRAEDALRGNKTKAEYRDALDDMIAESDQLIRIFNSMLLISRVEAGYTNHQAETVELSVIAQDLAELFEPVVDEQNGMLVTNVADGLMVDGNRELIGQALTNLIDNAIKYGAEVKPVITVSAGENLHKKTIEVSVSDNGAGIPAEKYEHVMERFVRLDESRTDNGSGLGLSLVSAIMKLHKGNLELSDNKPGLRATLSFPAKTEKPMSKAKRMISRKNG